MDADKIQQYKPVDLLNVLSTKVANKVVSRVQTTFIEDRFILDGVVLIHEVMHELHKGKSDVIIFKVDFEIR